MTIHEQDFTNLIKSAGIPTTESEIKKQWQEINESQGGLIQNDSQWSAFWLLITAIVTKPAQWLIEFMIKQLLPNSFIKTASGAYLDILAWSLKVERKPATKSQGFIVFIRENTENNIIIQAGTIIKSALINNKNYSLMTTTATPFNNGALTVNVAVEAVEAGANYNLAPNYYNELVEQIDGIVSVANNADWLINHGVNIESDDALRARCRNQFISVGLFHHDAAYRAIISTFANIEIDYIWFEHDAPRGAGSANAFIMIESGLPPQSLIDDINYHIITNGYHGHGDDLQVFAITTKLIDLNINLYIDDSLVDSANIVDEIGHVIKCAFRQNFNYNVTKILPYRFFSFSVLSQELHLLFNALTSVEFNSLDIQASNKLTVLNNLTINTFNQVKL